MNVKVFIVDCLFDISDIRSSWDLIGRGEFFSKMWDELFIYKTYIGLRCLGLSFESWADLAWIDFYVGRVGMGQVGFGSSCPAPDQH